jgi:hypothetical protein
MNNVLLEGLAPDELIGLFRSLFSFYRFKDGIPLALVPGHRLKIVRTKTHTINFHDILIGCLSLLPSLAILRGVTSSLKKLLRPCWTKILSSHKSSWQDLET